MPFQRQRLTIVVLLPLESPVFLNLSCVFNQVLLQPQWFLSLFLCFLLPILLLFSLRLFLVQVLFVVQGPEELEVEVRLLHTSFLDLQVCLLQLHRPLQLLVWKVQIRLCPVLRGDLDTKVLLDLLALDRHERLRLAVLLEAF